MVLKCKLFLQFRDQVHLGFFTSDPRVLQGQLFSSSGIRIIWEYFISDSWVLQCKLLLQLLDQGHLRIFYTLGYLNNKCFFHFKDKDHLRKPHGILRTQVQDQDQMRTFHFTPQNTPMSALPQFRHWIILEHISQKSNDTQTKNVPVFLFQKQNHSSTKSSRLTIIQKECKVLSHKFRDQSHLKVLEWKVYIHCLIKSRHQQPFLDNS